MYGRYDSLFPLLYLYAFPFLYFLLPLYFFYVEVLKKDAIPAIVA
jgi:hypothetical protein